ncbi:MAG: hypothetical protein PHF97_03950 [Bacteroidales bacterium]|nr:hypothetical protein [Bacteroidales bacterium]
MKLHLGRRLWYLDPNKIANNGNYFTPPGIPEILRDVLEIVYEMMHEFNPNRFSKLW